MLISAYGFSSLCLIAALALAIALLLRIIDSKLRLLRVIPSPLKGWQHLCQRFVTKLYRKERSANALRMRSRILMFSLIVAAFIIGTLLSELLFIIDHDYLDIILLGLLFFVAPPQALPHPADEAATFRYEVETGGIMLLQRISAPLLGWLLLSWSGLLIALTLGFLCRFSALTHLDFSRPITRLSNLVFIPATVLTCLLLSFAAAFTSKGRPLVGLRAGLEHITAPHKAVTLTIAEALSFSLAGPKGQYLGLICREWLGKGTARLQIADVKRWYWLTTIALGLLIALLLVLSL